FEEYRKAAEAMASLKSEINERDDKRPTAEDEQQLERMEGDVALWHKETLRLAETAKRSKEVDEVRAQFADLFTQTDKSERTVAKTDGDRLLDIHKRYVDSGQLTGFESTMTRNHLQALKNRYSARAMTTFGGTAIDTTFIDQVLFYEV